MMFPSRPMLCVITDEELPPVTFARQALWGGATILQLRNKTASGRDLCRWSEAILPLTRQHNALFIVNDRLDIALATGADGVHLGQDDLPATVARKLLGPDRIIGVSTGTREEALQAEKEGADYVGFGHIFPTGSKDKPLPPVGTLALQDTASLLSIPLIAIGGIQLENARRVISCGASGIAVISAVSRHPDPRIAAEALVREMEEGMLL
ncbi:thiamine phosphate synthase [Chlorobium phaeovibrioides]|uniref:Thiamine-phosphate synthase n=1 Tax=Chlorobium phaeovibrioides (strain DSM 265 / 1930) TaxID=290318 RepID=THIE_CHLPM|nr:thiamine phosphate synthase [Chlorobium phaeovibrioides]A4SEP8.1 RecName: Full=Thiamine-phosphate synthase; Short=TP synthase; Short=TPS; AltName: Full=Thiamine-phosphate pyrophosphorylase; Short=TMP pyrophosphorylase; Short=TMP-PPase [Chlorobium phaeovibrioides DSM 265]RTY37430.1 thiamine phosphate synthase [Chlorobium phaeovibrioides]HCD36451.1 thiamine phosphate synthase [Chlorobium sp.]